MLQTLPTLFDAVFTPGRETQVAVLYEQRKISYGELREQTIHAAEVLRALGLQPRERVAILLNDSPEFIAVFLAIQSLGGIAVPINMALQSDEQRFILGDCAARVVVLNAKAEMIEPGALSRFAGV